MRISHNHSSTNNFYVQGGKLNDEKKKKPVKIDIDKTNPVPVDRNGFESLVLPPGHRKVVQALVKMHSQGQSSSSQKIDQAPQMDLVRGKGSVPYFLSRVGLHSLMTGNRKGAHTAPARSPGSWENQYCRYVLLNMYYVCLRSCMSSTRTAIGLPTFRGCASGGTWRRG